MSIASCTSPRVSASTLPISRVISRDNSSFRFSSNSAARYKISARFGAGTSRHVLYASVAASTAASTSAAPDDTNIPTSSSVFAGLRFSYASPPFGSTHSPLIKFLYIRPAATVAMRLPPKRIRAATTNPRRKLPPQIFLPLNSYRFSSLLVQNHSEPQPRGISILQWNPGERQLHRILSPTWDSTRARSLRAAIFICTSAAPLRGFWGAGYNQLISKDLDA